MLRIGHRGAAGHAPENTLRSIEKAIALGCDFVEVDVRCTRDDHLIVIHDRSVDRTTSGRGEVSTLPLDELLSFDAGQGKRIPTLEQVLQRCDGHVGLILDIKAEGLAAHIRSIVRTSGLSSSVIYASFETADVLSIRHADPDAGTMLLFDRLPKPPVERVLQTTATYAGLRFDTVTPPIVSACHEAGTQVFVYTVNEPADIRRMRSLAVDGIISDYPDRI